ncbi:hypothetical protein HPT29_027990 (plasmid) [Microvirga terrae]|uniref:Uncharacterized protein n=1 Tax=Microvirga terrae TaxID=2740529 RepID=A0ABY5S2A3_9HYPH|nr:hypothetical protein [Microvirga terrae]UVF22656.1 hypothetical protein HPT29_027990 [Microvirga terrae]
MTRALTAADVEDFADHNHDPSVNCHKMSFEDVLRSPFHWEGKLQLRLWASSA